MSRPDRNPVAGGRGVAVDAETPADEHRRSLSEYEHAYALLGPRRPATNEADAAWHDAAAQAIADYRTRYEIDPNEAAPLGPEPPAGAFQQRLDRRQAAETIATRCASSGAPSTGDPTAGRVCGSTEPLERDLDRSNGWEP
jgi:hypothetical protein